MIILNILLLKEFILLDMVISTEQKIILIKIINDWIIFLMS
jgi:hypothetical protein